MDAEWQLDAFDAECSPYPEDTFRSRSNSPTSFSSPDSRSSTAEPEKPVDIAPSRVTGNTRTQAQVQSSELNSLGKKPAPVSTDAASSVAGSVTIGVSNLANAELDADGALLRTLGVLKSIGVPVSVDRDGNIQTPPDIHRHLVPLENQRTQTGRAMPMGPDGASTMLPGVSPVAGGVIFPIAPNSQKSAAKDPQYSHLSDFRKKESHLDELRPRMEAPLPEPMTTLEARALDDALILDAHELELHLQAARHRKRAAEERLEIVKNRPGTVPDTTRNHFAGVGMGFVKSQRLFAVAQVQLRKHLGMELDHSEAELAEEYQGPREHTEHRIRDVIFIEDVKCGLLTLQIFDTKRLLEAQEEAIKKQRMQDVGAIDAPSRMAAANVTAARFATRKSESTQSMWLAHEEKRKERREKQNEEVDDLPHKSTQATLPAVESIRPNPYIPKPPLYSDRILPAWEQRILRLRELIGEEAPSLPPTPHGDCSGPGHKIWAPSPPMQTPESRTSLPPRLVLPSPLDPRLSSQMFSRVPPPPRAPGAPIISQPSASDFAHLIPPPPPPPGRRTFSPSQSAAPPPVPPGRLPESSGPSYYRLPPGWRPGAAPPPGWSAGAPPPPRPAQSSDMSRGPINPPPALPTGLSVKISTSTDGTTTATLTTNPEFDTNNSIEIVTKTIRSGGGTVTTFTTATLTPLVRPERKVRGCMSGRRQIVIPRRSPISREASCGDKSDSSRVSSLFDD